MSYKHLLQDCIYAPMLKVAGRLDQDTTGLVVASSDGALIHRIISPNKSKDANNSKEKWDKEYIVTCAKEVSDTDLSQLEQGVRLDDDYLTLSSKTVRISACVFRLILLE